MTQGGLNLWFGAGILALVALALWRAVVAARRARRPPRHPDWWTGLVFRGALIVALLGVGVASVISAPSPWVNHPSPAAESDIVALLPIKDSETENIVEGVSARDGALRWKWTTPGRVVAVKSGPPGVAYVSVNPAPPTAPDSLVALRLADGESLWRHDGLALTSGYADQQQVIGYNGGRVYAREFTAPNSGHIVALDAMTGALVWRVPLPIAARYDTMLVATSDMVILAGDETGIGERWHMVALRAANGARAWEMDSGPTDITFGPTTVPRLWAARDTLFIQPYSQPLYALDPQTGARLWTNMIEAAPDITVTLDTLYEQIRPSSGPYSGRWTLAARDPRTGRILWSKPGYAAGGLLFVASALVEADMNGVRALDTMTRATLWSWQATPSASPVDLAASAPAVTSLPGDGGVVYIERTETSADTLSGAFGWRGYSSGLCVAPTWVYAVNARSGAPWWRIQIGTTRTCHLVL